MLQRGSRVRYNKHMARSFPPLADLLGTVARVDGARALVLWDDGLHDHAWVDNLEQVQER